MEKAKNILFKLYLKGNGVVNFDDGRQFNILKDHCGVKMPDKATECFKFAKKSFRKINDKDNNEDGQTNPDIEYNLKISSACLKHEIYKDDPSFNVKYCINEPYCVDFITSIAGLLRGYFIPRENGKGNTLNLTTRVGITDAEEISNAMTYIEINTQDIKKEPKKGTKDKGGTSLYYTENVGATEYMAKGHIDIKELKFLSGSEDTNRQAITQDWINCLEPFFRNHYPELCKEGLPYEVGFFTKIKEECGKAEAEYGLKFKDEFVKYLTIEAIKRLLSVHIKRGGSYAQTARLQIRFVYDALVDTYDSNSIQNPWYTVVTDDYTGDGAEDGIVPITFDEITKRSFEDFYREVPEEEVSGMRKELKIK